MEFSRRGPASTGAGADGGHRFPDPPAQGERDPMPANRFPDPPSQGEREATLAMREALLSQLHMASLRQEIVEAELAKIERAMALRAATTGGHQTTPMPMPWYDMATAADAGRWQQQWPCSTNQPMAQHDAESDEHKLPGSSNKDSLLSQLHMARLRQEIIQAELAKIESATALCAATGGHQTQTTQMPMPWHGAAAGRSKPWLFNAEQPMAQQNAEFDENKIQDSNKVSPPSKASPTELTGIQIPVMKPKSPLKGNDTVCQVQATSEQNLQQHYDGQKHLPNEATLDPTTKASDKKTISAAEHSLSTEQKKTSSIKWSCSTCQANGTSQSTLEAHLKGKRHQQNMAATCVDGDIDGIAKNVAVLEAKSHGINVLKNSEKPWLFIAEQPVAREFDEHKLPDSNKAVPTNKASPVEKWELTGITIPVPELKPAMKWNCTVCQVQATSEQNLEQHYAGQKHLSNVGTLDPTTKSSDHKVKSAADHSVGTEQKKTSSIKWSCSTCLANGSSQLTLDAHLKGKRHQQNIAATYVEGDMDGMPKNVATQEAKSHGINVPKNSKKPWPFIAEQPMAQQFDEHKLPDANKAVPPSKASPVEKWKLAEIMISVKEQKPPMKWNCTVCQVQETSEQDLQNHYAGQKHLSNVATLDPTTKASDQKAKTAAAAEPSLSTEEKKTSSIKWSCSTCQANGTTQFTLEAHLKGKRHPKNIAAATSAGGKNVVAQEAKPHGIDVSKHSEKLPSAWSCSICEVTCTCQTDLENHLTGMARDSESRKAILIPDSRWICRICHAHCTSEPDLENHLAGTRHQLNTQALGLGERKNPPQVAKNHEQPFAKWNCTVCDAKCNSESQFEAHCRSSRHQQKIQAMILGKGKVVKASSSRVAKNPSSEMEEKQPAVYFCEVCNVLFENSTMLVHHRFGKKHRAKLSTCKE